MATRSLRPKWSFKNQILTLYYAFKDERTPWYARITAISSLIYLLSPADLLPDVIPFAGYIDDLFIVPLLVNISTRLLPPDIRRIAEEKARHRSKKFMWWAVAAGVIVILIVLYFLFSDRF
jgi:uncharacterized membrane protein YkvA (DUF1232 family)